MKSFFFDDDDGDDEKYNRFECLFSSSKLVKLNSGIKMIISENVKIRFGQKWKMRERKMGYCCSSFEGSVAVAAP